MKNRILFSALVAIIATAVVSCDKIENPYEPTPPKGNFDSTKAVKNSVEGSTLRNAFVEDYTGHTCGNCPIRARELKTFLSTYAHKEKVIVCAVHSSGFAIPKADYPNDFRTPEAEAYFADGGSSPLGISSNPAFLINRVYDASKSKIFITPLPASAAFSTTISSIANQPSDFKLDLSTAYDTVNRTINATVTLKALKNLSSNYKAVVFLMEDSVISDQKDYNYDDIGATEEHIHHFEHEHLFRGTLNGAWGQDVFKNTTPSANATESFTIEGFKVKEVLNNFPINPKHCYIVAYVYDADSNNKSTYYQILQAEEVKLIK